MNIIYNYILGILSILILFNIVFIYNKFNNFTCPDCPECPSFDKNIIPSNKYLTNYIIDNLIDRIEENSSIYLINNVIFSNKIIVNYENESEAYIGKIRNEFNEMDKFNEDKLKYIQYNSDTTKNNFLKKYNINEYPKPLIKYDDCELLFGYIKNKWMIFYDADKI